MRRRLRRAGLALLLASSVACAGASEEPPATLVVNFLTPATVRSVTLEISGPGITTPITSTIAIGADTTARATLELPAGTDRRVLVSAFDQSGIRTHRAETTINVNPGSNPPLGVQLTALTGSVSLTVTFGGTRITLANASARTIAVGDTVRLTATATRANGTALPADSLEWGSTNPGVLTVTRGLVRGVMRGSGAAVVSYQGIAAWVNVTVGTTAEPVALQQLIPEGGR